MDKDAIRLIVRADDLGMSHAVNTAITQSFRKGVLTCASLQAPAPWAEEAAMLSRANPSWCVGVHLTVIGEWRGYPWRPVLPWDKVRSLTDKNGFFHRSPSEFYDAVPDYRELEMELRAQIELLHAWKVKIRYADTHYFSAFAPDRHPKFMQVVRELCKEYRLPLSGQSGEQRLETASFSAGLKKAMFRKQMREIGPGLWIKVHHILDDSVDSRAFVHTDPAEAKRGQLWRFRTAEKYSLLDPEVKRIIRKRRIQLTDYKNFRG